MSKPNLNLKERMELQLNLHNIELCDGERLKTDISFLNDKFKKFNKYKKKCDTRHIKKEYRGEITLRMLLDIIKKENKENVQDFLDLFIDTSEKGEGDKTTKNHVFEALWILVFLPIALVTGPFLSDLFVSLIALIFVFLIIKNIYFLYTYPILLFIP